MRIHLKRFNLVIVSGIILVAAVYPSAAYSLDYFGRRDLKVIISGFVTAVALIYALVFYRTIAKKRRQASPLIRIAGEKDPLWNEAIMNEVFREAYSRYFQAYRESEPLHLEQCSTRTFFRQQSEIILHARGAGHKYVFNDLALEKFMPVSVRDFRNDDQDSFVMYVQSSCIRYLFSADTGQVISGSSTEKTTIYELWYFKRSADQWKLDEIRSNVNCFDVDLLESVVE